MSKQAGAPRKKAGQAPERLEPFRASFLSDARLRKEAEYFLYLAPGIDSALSADTLSLEDAEGLINALAADAHAKPERLRFGNRHKYRMDKEEMLVATFGKCEFYCHTRQKEPEPCSLLRHLRNAIAHGNTFVKKTTNNTYLAFLDFDKDGKPSAKIITTAAALKRWRATFESADRVSR